MSFRLTFHPNDGSRPPRVLADVDLTFDDSDELSGLKLVGITVWRSRDAQALLVTLPGRAFGMGSDRAYFDYLRPADDRPGSRGALQALKLRIAAEYRQQFASSRSLIGEKP